MTVTFAMVGELQKKLAIVGGNFDEAAMTDEQFHMVMECALQMGRYLKPRSELLNIVIQSKRKIHVNPTRSGVFNIFFGSSGGKLPSETAYKEARTGYDTLLQQTNVILDCASQPIKESVASSVNHSKAAVQNLPALNDPSKMGKEEFDKALAERASKLGGETLGVLVRTLLKNPVLLIGLVIVFLLLFGVFLLPLLRRG